jgi:hypothetical protein
MLYRALGFPAQGFRYRKFRIVEERPTGPVPWEEEEKPKTPALAPSKRKEKKLSAIASAPLARKGKKQSLSNFCEGEKEQRPSSPAIYMNRDNSHSGSQLNLIWEEEEHWDEVDRIGRAYTCDVARMA